MITLETGIITDLTGKHAGDSEYAVRIYAMAQDKQTLAGLSFGIESESDKASVLLPDGYCVVRLDAVDAANAELEALRAFKASVPWEALGDNIARGFANRRIEDWYKSQRSKVEPL